MPKPGDSGSRDIGNPRPPEGDNKGRGLSYKTWEQITKASVAPTVLDVSTTAPKDEDSSGDPAETRPGKSSLPKDAGDQSLSSHSVEDRLRQLLISTQKEEVPQESSVGQKA
jgi:hypothetical protein